MSARKADRAVLRIRLPADGQLAEWLRERAVDTDRDIGDTARRLLIRMMKESKQ